MNQRKNNRGRIKSKTTNTLTILRVNSHNYKFGKHQGLIKLEEREHLKVEPQITQIFIENRTKEVSSSKCINLNYLRIYPMNYKQHVKSSDKHRKILR